MLADVPQTLTDVGVYAGVLAAIITTAGLVSRLRPVKWLWRTIISDPAAGWFRREVAEEIEQALVPVKAELSANGGDSVKDMAITAARIATRIADQKVIEKDAAYERHRLQDERFQAGSDRMDRIESQLGEVIDMLTTNEAGR